MEVVHSNLAHKINRGDDSMIVKEMHVGKTRVLIDNSNLCKTTEEREKVDREIALAAWSIIDELLERGEAV